RHDDDKRHLRGLCMPYFGGATLGQILDKLRHCSLAQPQGQDFLDALQEAGASDQVSRLVGGPHCSLLATKSYVYVICWIGAYLADGLQYAQGRSLVPLDVKPSNVRVAAAGQPLLLDFPRARPPLQPGGQQAEWLGGTIGYMAPEQNEAMDALRAGA